MTIAYLQVIESYLAFFFAVCLFLKKNKHISDYYLVAWLLVLSVFMFCKSNDTHVFAVFVNILYSTNGIILYLYIKNITINLRFNPKDLFHFIPFAVIILPMFIINDYIFSITYWILIVLLFLTYIILSILMVRKYKQIVKESYSNVEYADLSWLHLLIYGSFFFAINPIIKILYSGYPSEMVVDIASFIFMNVVGLKGGLQSITFIKQPLKINSIPENKPAYTNYGLRSLDAEKLSEKLNEYMESEKAYLNPDLSLKDLAVAMGTYTHYITQVLNTIFNQNFYDFVNRYRIEEAEYQLIDPQKANFTILAIAFDCGFNSKATFNRVFKGKNGVTPREYKLTAKR